jgi:hypothetical protein
MGKGIRAVPYRLRERLLDAIDTILDSWHILQRHG